MRNLINKLKQKFNNANSCDVLILHSYSVVAQSLVGICLIFIGCTQCAIYKQQATLMRDSDRPWVSPNGMILVKPLEGASIIRYQLNIEDTGKQPAVGALYKFHSFLIDYVSDSQWNDSDLKLGANATCDELEATGGKKATIFPTNPENERVWLIGEDDQVDDVAKILNKKKALILEGCILYPATGQSMRHSAFRYFLRDFPGSTFTVDKNWNLERNWQFNKLADSDDAN